MRRPANSLTELIHPVSVESFLTRYWERTFLHQKATQNGASELFSLQEIDQWLHSTRHGLPDSIMIASPDGAEVRTEKYSPGSISIDKIYAAASKGHSIIINHLEDWPLLTGTVKSLARDLLADIGVNAYLTPRNSRTFPIHTDEHDVFIIQIEGEKIWHLHDFSLLQIKIPQKKNIKFPKEWYNRTKTQEIAELTLQPGDFLYIPRGMPHYAVAKESTSLHLTFSITPLYWMDFLKIAVECAATHSQALRKSLPVDFLNNEATCDAMRASFDEAMLALQSISFKEALDAVKRNRVRFQGFPPDGHLAHILSERTLTPDTEVERRPNLLCTVDEIWDPQMKSKAALFFGSEYVLGPLHLTRAFSFIRDHDRFQISELPGLDQNSQITLARRLINEGLLRLIRQDKDDD